MPINLSITEKMSIMIISNIREDAFCTSFIHSASDGRFFNRGGLHCAHRVAANGVTRANQQRAARSEVDATRTRALRLSRTGESQSRSRFEGWTLDIGRVRWESVNERKRERGARSWSRHPLIPPSSLLLRCCILAFVIFLPLSLSFSFEFRRQVFIHY